MNNIPATVIQTSKYKLKSSVKNKILEKCSSKYTYRHFTDEEILEYFEKNSITEFPNVIQVFNSFTTGAHKADLFRYYYLYLEGGIYIDTDIELLRNIDIVIKDYDFVSVESTHQNVLFNGFIAVVPKHKMLYDLLTMTYNLKNVELQKDYLLICRKSFLIYLNYQNSIHHIYKEREYMSYTIINDTNTVTPLLIHYWEKKDNLL